MQISMDGQGYVNIDNTYSSANINTVRDTLTNIANQLKQYDDSVVNLSMLKMMAEYDKFTNFTEMLNRWERILQEMEI